MQVLAQAPVGVTTQRVVARSSARAAAPLNAKAGKAASQRLASISSVRVGCAGLQRAVACRAARSSGPVSVSAVSFVEPQHVIGLTQTDPDVFLMDIRSDKEFKMGPKPPVDRKQYVFNSLMHSVDFGVEPNLEFIPMLKDKWRGERKERAKVLIMCKDGMERSVIAYNKMTELGFKVKVVRGGYDAWISGGAPPPSGY